MMTFLLGLVVGLVLGGTLGALLMSIMMMGKFTQMQDELDAWEATRWRSIDQP